MIHQSYGVYPNMGMVRNGVPTEHLKEHIAFNIKHRPGRALIVDGVCLFKGNLDQVKIDAAMIVIMQQPYLGHDTQPYA